MPLATAAPAPAADPLRHDASLVMTESVERVIAAIDAIATTVPPVWPLADYVAVNPFLGLAHKRFLDARQVLRDVRDCEMLPPAKTLFEQFTRGEMTATDIEQAYRQGAEDYPEWFCGHTPQSLVEILTAAATPTPKAKPTAGKSPTAATSPTSKERRYLTVSEAIDGRQGSSWSSHIVTDISRHCAAHYDRGQAAWPTPWKHLPLYESWRETMRLSHRMDLLGIRGFRHFVKELPANPAAAIASLLERMAIPEAHWQGFLFCQLLSVAGWASYLTYRSRQSEGVESDHQRQLLTELMAIRLTYDAALAQARPGSIDPARLHPTDAALPTPSADALARYLFQSATELAYRRRLLLSLSEPRPIPTATNRRTLQIIFCIDVRSEVFRRHLEAASDSVETFGFAGFFGMPLELVPLGASQGPAQCPVLLTPAFRVHERVTLAGEVAADTLQDQAISTRHALRQSRKIWKAFQASATSSFSFVESLGLAYLPQLFGNTFGWTRPVSSAGRDGIPKQEHASLGPDIHAPGPDQLTLDQQTNLAAGMLRNLGLVGGFARIVAICGHASEVVNNPYRAGLDCGACGGHSGEPNARVAAALLNAPAVRASLATRGITIPVDTWFVPAVHTTTTDTIRFLDTDQMPVGHAAEFEQVKKWLADAGAAARLERCPRLGIETAATGRAEPSAAAQLQAAMAIFSRSRDWSEVRPEWGLAGNAAFIVAPRARTAGLDLGGRTFMHSYDHHKDPDGAVLELIMTAPMIVTSWINLQYYASAVDNRAFGSGNKLIHNVTGQLGVLLGNGGDLMTGLPWQSVSDGTQLQHEPLRLLVLIEAPRQSVERVIANHAVVRDLVCNGWLTLVVCEAGGFYRWTAAGTWQPDSVFPSAP
jgi:uncharacterized protein YbcC (UPF0753/DUF2309 family)